MPQSDRAIAALIKDLGQRGLLDETLIIWGGEFGRTPMMQNNVRSELKKGYIGRDHHPFAFTMWMAGGGVRVVLLMERQMSLATIQSRME